MLNNIKKQFNKFGFLKKQQLIFQFSQNNEEQREYFFFIDHKGLLYLEESEPKNFTNCIKDKRFLKHFYFNLKENDSGRHKEYKWLHECWGEYNYIKAAHFPIVFQSIEVDLDEKAYIIFNNYQKISFEPSNLMVNQDGILVYAIDNNQKDTKLKFGALSSDLASQLSDNLYFENENYYFSWNNNNFQIPSFIQ